MTRSLSGMLFTSLLLVCSQLGPNTLVALFFVFMCFAVYEMSKMLDHQSLWPYATACLLYAKYTPWITAKEELLIESGIGLCMAIVFVLPLFDKNKKSVPNIGKAVLILTYACLPFLFLQKIPFATPDKSYDGMLIIGFFVLIWSNDTFAYLVGRKVGKHKLIEHISPRKTVEGLIGGLLMTFLTGFILSKYCVSLTQIQWLQIAAITAIFGVLGDLVASLFKRYFDVKDTGRLIPGHGGIIDRLDSAMFAAPVVYLFLKLTHFYVS